MCTDSVAHARHKYHDPALINSALLADVGVAAKLCTHGMFYDDQGLSIFLTLSLEHKQK